MIATDAPHSGHPGPSELSQKLPSLKGAGTAEGWDGTVSLAICVARSCHRLSQTTHTFSMMRRPTGLAWRSPLFSRRYQSADKSHR